VSEAGQTVDLWFEEQDVDEVFDVLDARYSEKLLEIRTTFESAR